jgi:hypothetical protein
VDHRRHRGAPPGRRRPGRGRGYQPPSGGPHGPGRCISVIDSGTYSNGSVWTTISAAQTDGSARTYSGTYTVDNGVIVSASITQTS